MSQQTSGTITLTAGAAITQYARVILSADRTVIEAVATDKADYLGVAQTEAASGATVTVALKNGARTYKCIAEEASAVNAVIYAANAGKVKDTSNGNPIGTALEAATADGDIIECVLLDQVAVV